MGSAIAGPPLKVFAPLPFGVTAGINKLGVPGAAAGPPLLPALGLKIAPPFLSWDNYHY